MKINVMYKLKPHVKWHAVSNKMKSSPKRLNKNDIKNNLLLAGPKKKKMRVIEDEAVKDIKQVTDEESDEEEKQEQKSEFMDEEKKQVTDVNSEESEESEEDDESECKKQITGEESEEEKEKYNGLKISGVNENIEEQNQKKISNGSNKRYSALNENDDDDDGDDSEDNMVLQYDSDGSIIDDDDNVVNYSKNVQMTPEERKSLDTLVIKLEHEVAPQHKVEKMAGTRVLTKQEREEFEKYAELRTGTFLKSENKILRRNWKKFCSAHGWNINNPKPFLQMRHKNKVCLFDFKQRKRFIQFLAYKLNNRSLYSVFNRFKVLYDPHKVSRYSQHEDYTILKFISHYKISDQERDRKFAELATILKRTRASVWRRYRVLMKKRKIAEDLKKIRSQIK